MCYHTKEKEEKVTTVTATITATTTYTPYLKFVRRIIFYLREMYSMGISSFIIAMIIWLIECVFLHTVCNKIFRRNISDAVKCIIIFRSREREREEKMTVVMSINKRREKNGTNNKVLENHVRASTNAHAHAQTNTANKINERYIHLKSPHSVLI